MAANTTPIFTLTPRADVAQVSAANTLRDGTGTTVNVAAAGTNGTLINSITVIAAVTVTAGVVRLFINNGTNVRLYKEIMVTATTPSASVETFRSVFIPDVPLILPTGYTLVASTHNAEAFNVHVSGGDF